VKASDARKLYNLLKGEGLVAKVSQVKDVAGRNAKISILVDSKLKVFSGENATRAFTLLTTFIELADTQKNLREGKIDQVEADTLNSITGAKVVAGIAANALVGAAKGYATILGVAAGSLVIGTTIGLTGVLAHEYFMKEVAEDRAMVSESIANAQIVEVKSRYFKKILKALENRNVNLAWELVDKYIIYVDKFKSDRALEVYNVTDFIGVLTDLVSRGADSIRIENKLKAFYSLDDEGKETWVGDFEADLIDVQKRGDTQLAEMLKTVLDGEKERKEAAKELEDSKQKVELADDLLARQRIRLEEERQAKADVDEFMNTSERKKTEKKSTVSMFRKKLKKEQMNADRTIDQDKSDNVYSSAFDRGAEEVEAFEKYEQALKENIAAKKHLAEVEERIRRQEAENARSDAAFWAGIGDMVSGVAIATNEYQQTKNSYSSNSSSNSNLWDQIDDMDDYGDDDWDTAFQSVNTEPLQNRVANPQPKTPTRAPPETIKRKDTSGLSDITVNKTPTTVEIWDHSQEDGDQVQVSLNGRVIHSNVTLMHKRFRMVLQLYPGVNRLEFKALNVGTADIPKNSAAVKVSNVTTGSQSQKWHMDTGQVGVIVVNFQP
jgi:hypothetical protein